MDDQDAPAGGSDMLSKAASRSAEPRAIPRISCSTTDVFGGTGGLGDPYIEIADWSTAVQVFVGRNGSGKTRTALALLREARRHVDTYYLASDRLFGLTTSGHHGGNLMGPSGEFPGVAPNPEARRAAKGLSDNYGLAAAALFSLYDSPLTRIRVTAAIQEALGRTIDFSNRNGLIDPVVNFESLTYPLLRSEGHGLRELVVLLDAIYRPDWSLLIVDEPELNLHPSLTRLWMNLLRDECKASGRRAVVITHEPRLIDPRSSDDLNGIWLFRPLRHPVRMSEPIQAIQIPQVDRDLGYNPQLVSDLVFSPDPVLIEGDKDLAAFQSAARRIGTHSSVSQTDFIRCGGVDAVARWLEIAQGFGLRVRAVADLDALFNLSFARTADAFEAIQVSYMQQWQVRRTTDAIKLLHDEMRKTKPVPTDPATRREWLREVLASDKPDMQAARMRGEQLLRIWKDAGIWLHPQGDLERVLGVNGKPDAREYAARAEQATEFDGAVRWALSSPQESPGMLILLEVEIERIAQDIQRFTRLNPGRVCVGPVGPFAEADSQLVTVQSLGNGRCRIQVKEPPEFQGLALEFDRSTAPDEMHLYRH